MFADLVRDFVQLTCKFCGCTVDGFVQIPVFGFAGQIMVFQIQQDVELLKFRYILYVLFQ